ncbi:unnamed protein product [Haemonchus placei]|uniref:EGF-like domain-containing protein n=1 Tax=Haemonchus placei TaxID=6290 RepID=A0A0N4WL12_HAEPC|nr:unnamed protein product [Haemonchus placei]
MSFTSSTVFFIPLLVIWISISVDAREDQIGDLHRYHRHRIRSTFQHRRQPVCVHGKPVDGECECEQDYTGRHCEKQKHCASFRRFRNGSCPTCSPGYYGEFCEEIHCVHGEPSDLETKCECEEPYSGTFCDELSTKQVYSYYNRRVKRVGEMLGDQNIAVNKTVLQHLLMELIG